MKIIVTLLIVFFVPGLAYSKQYQRCDEPSRPSPLCKPKDLLYTVPKGGIYAKRIHNPRKIPDAWCPNKPYLITRAELVGNLRNNKDIKKDSACQEFKRYTAKIWAGDPYCLDRRFEARTLPDWEGEFYACAENIRTKLGEKYFLVYAMAGDSFDHLDQVIDANRVLNSDTGEKQRGFVSVMITHEEEVAPVVKIIRTKEESLALLARAVHGVAPDALKAECQVRPHNSEKKEKFDAFISVTARKSGRRQHLISMNIIENVSHGLARKALDIEMCKEIHFFGY